MLHARMGIYNNMPIVINKLQYTSKISFSNAKGLGSVASFPQ